MRGRSLSLVAAHNAIIKGRSFSWPRAKIIPPPALGAASEILPACGLILVPAVTHPGSNT